MKSSFAAALVSLGLSFSVSPSFAQVAVQFPQDTIVATVASCSSDSDCKAAIQALLDQFAAANPDVDPALLLASLVSAIASAYNAGLIPAIASQFALTAVASVATAAGFDQIAQSASQAASVVASGGTIDLEAVAEVSGSPA